ncbi:MAG: MotA/TolQ/ExbB proton channel family protein [Cellvibrionaceae bacterium]
MDNKTPDFIKHLIALVIAMVVVHIAYLAVIRPVADAEIKAQLALQESGQTVVAERSLAVILKDYEQEACFILMFWAFSIMGLKALSIQRERRSLSNRLINTQEGMRILPNDSREYSRHIENLSRDEKDCLLPRSLLTALHRFQSTHNIQDTATAIKETCETEADRLDSELSLVRYIAWAIPSIGFIGTVRGIGEALTQAHRAVEGDIAGVTASLGVAFNSTFTALLISIVVMFFVHQLQLAQEKLIIDTQQYCDKNLLRFLQVS